MAKQSDPTLLRCLAIQQPWAWAVCAGLKTVENRTVSTPYRGLIAILASTKKTNVNELIRSYPELDLEVDFFAYGAVIGVANLVDVVDVDHPSVKDNPSAFGPLCWVLQDAKLLPLPVLAKGKLNLYTLDAVESQAVRDQLSVGTRPASNAATQAWITAYRTDLLTKRAWAAYHEKQLDPALTHFTAALEVYPQNGPAFYGRQQCLLDQNNSVEVIRDCSAALTSGPENVVALVLRQKAYLLRGETQKAEADFAAAIAINPDEAEFWENLDTNDMEEDTTNEEE